MTDPREDESRPSDRGDEAERAPDEEAASGFPEPPGKDPGDRSQDPSPHHALSNPIDAPDESEWPDPYDRREDPREPPPDAGLGEQPHPPSGSASTSEPHPSQDPEGVPWEGPKRDKVDE